MTDPTPEPGPSFSERLDEIVDAHVEVVSKASAAAFLEACFSEEVIARDADGVAVGLNMPEGVLHVIGDSDNRVSCCGQLPAELPRVDRILSTGSPETPTCPGPG